MNILLSTLLFSICCLASNEAFSASSGSVDVIQVTKVEDIHDASTMEAALDGMVSNVKECVQGKLAPSAECFCLYPNELSNLKKTYEDTIKSHPNWKDKAVSYMKDARSITVSLSGIGRQLENKCGNTPQMQTGKASGPSPETTTTRLTESYSLFQTVNGAVIKVVSGKRGEHVQLLKNPVFRKMGEGEKAVTIPISPKDPVWEEVPDGACKTIAFGNTYIIKGSKILQVLDRNGRDISSQ